MREKIATAASFLFFTALFTFIHIRSVEAFQKPYSKSNDDQAFSDTDEISYLNPLSYGELRPRLSGALGSVRLKVSGRELDWTGLVHQKRGAIQMWGEGALVWSDESFEEMETILRNLIDKNYEIFQFRSSDLVLNRGSTAILGTQRSMSFDRYFTAADVGRFKVENARVTFRFKFGQLVQITNNSFGEIGIIEAPVYSPDDAASIAAEDVMLTEGVDQISSQVAAELQPFFIRGGEVRFRVVYKVKVHKRSPYGIWLYSISAADANIVQLKSGLFSGQVMGEVTARLPGEELLKLPLPFVRVRTDQGEAFSDAFGRFSSNTLSAEAEFAGALAHVMNKKSRPVKQKSDSSGNILFTASRSLDENMTFFHVSRVNLWVSQFLKMDFLKNPIRINTRVDDAEMKHCNAWFDPDDESLNFLPKGEASGMHCNSTAQIADVIYHEWGHALDNALGGIQDGSFSEGIGDITAFLITGDSRLAPRFFSNQEDELRNSNIVKVYPRDRDPSDPHMEGQIVSGAWWEVFSQMKAVHGDQEGIRKTSEIFFKHLTSAENYLESYQAALVLDDNDGDLSNCTPNFCIFNTAFARRGLTPYDDRCRSGGICVSQGSDWQ